MKHKILFHNFPEYLDSLMKINIQEYYGLRMIYFYKSAKTVNNSLGQAQGRDTIKIYLGSMKNDDEIIGTICHEYRHLIQCGNKKLPQAKSSLYKDADGKIIPSVYFKDRGEQDARRFSEMALRLSKIDFVTDNLTVYEIWRKELFYILEKLENYKIVSLNIDQHSWSNIIRNKPISIIH